MRNKIVSYGSVCSGIEAATYVLEPLGLKPLWLSEIAEFPKKFLSHTYPHVRNLGDMNDIPQMIEHDLVECPDLLCGGTPCQAFSLAGWKNGLNDDRGQLTLKYIDILNAIDSKRIALDMPRAVFMWENVEGILKDKTNAFGFFLAGLLNLDEPIVCRRWPNAGCLLGKNRNIAWRVLDAKYFGVPQQRKRLYVVGGGKNFDPFSVLFEEGDKISDPFQINQSNNVPSLFDDNKIENKRPLSADVNGHKIEVFREYSDCLYAAYGTKWNGNAASFNGSLFICQDGRVRRLTPKECERLMGFSDDYTNISPSVRVTNRYQAIGNSWAVPVVSWVMKRIIGEIPRLQIPHNSCINRSAEYQLFFLDDFMPSDFAWVNASVFPYDYKLTHMLDIVDTDADEKYYLSPAGCAGIIRRSNERKAGINRRLKYHLTNGFKYNPELIKSNCTSLQRMSM